MVEEEEAIGSVIAELRGIVRVDVSLGERNPKIPETDLVCAAAIAKRELIILAASRRYCRSLSD